MNCRKKGGLGGEVRCNEQDMGFCGDSFAAQRNIIVFAKKLLSFYFPTQQQ